MELLAPEQKSRQAKETDLGEFKEPWERWYVTLERLHLFYALPLVIMFITSW
jgi:hypothetical protein